MTPYAPSFGLVADVRSTAGIGAVEGIAGPK